MLSIYLYIFRIIYEIALFKTSTVLLLHNIYAIITNDPFYKDIIIGGF